MKNGLYVHFNQGAYGCKGIKKQTNKQNGKTGKGGSPVKASLSESSPACVTSEDWTAKPEELQ